MRTVQIAKQPAPYCAKSQCAHTQRHAAPQISRACPGHLPQRLTPGICSNQEQAKPTIITRRRAGSAIALQGFALKADAAPAKQGQEKKKPVTAWGYGLEAAGTANVWCAEPDSNRHGVATVRT